MKSARPVGGFKISCVKTVEALIAAEIEQCPPFEQHWKDILARLSFTAQTEGTTHSALNGHRMWVVAGDEDRGLRRVVLVFVALGDTVRIRVASVG